MKNIVFWNLLVFISGNINLVLFLLKHFISISIIQGHINLPSEDGMKSAILNVEEKRIDNYGTSQKYNFCVNGYKYMDMLAKDIGCNINWPHLLYHDPLLAYHCIFGVYSIRQYRLYGPNACPADARSSIINVWNRVRCPYGETKPRGTSETWPISNYTFVFILLLFLFSFYMLT